MPIAVIYMNNTPACVTGMLGSNTRGKEKILVYDKIITYSGTRWACFRNKDRNAYLKGYIYVNSQGVCMCSNDGGGGGTAFRE